MRKDEQDDSGGGGERRKTLFTPFVTRKKNFSSTL
jgi:hypothetical protein